MRQYFLICTCFFISISSYGQNLLPNSGFDSVTTKRIFLSGSARYFNKVINNWRCPAKSTPDIFNVGVPLNSGQGIPSNRVGYSFPRKGSGYIGLITFVGPTLDGGILFGKNDYSEYVQTKLISPLEKDKTYCVRLYYQLSKYSMYGSNGLAVHIGKKRLKSGKEFIPARATYQLDEIVTERSVWHPMCFEYTAKGEEEYFTIGRFIPFEEVDYKVLTMPKDTRLHKFYENSNRSYFYIDDVSLTLKGEGACECLDGEFVAGEDTVRLNKDYLVSEDSLITKQTINEISKKLLDQQQLYVILVGEVQAIKKFEIALKDKGVLPKQIKILKSEEELTYKLTFEP